MALTAWFENTGSYGGITEDATRLTTSDQVTVSKNRLRTHVVQDHTQCAHECSVAVLDRHCGGGAVRRHNTFKPAMQIHSMSFFFQPSPN